MPSFSAKDYQRSCLESVERYFTKCQELGDADWAFQKTTEEQAVLESLPGHDGLRVIYAAAVKGIGPAALARAKIIFKQTPYAIEV